MKIVYKGGSAELTEKKSRFIADVAPVNSEAEATAFIESVKKKYWDCKHNCSAFVIGENPPLTRCSDNGEPAGTAGRPMLEMLLGEDITNVCVVVSRYFGGVLLGTGGLVRAYGGAAKLGLQACVIAEKMTGNKITCQINYDMVGKIQYNAASLGLAEIASAYEEKVSLTYLAEASLTDKAVAAFTEITAGKAQILVSDPVDYIIAEGEIIFT